MTALDVLRVLAWPLVVLVVAMGVFKRLDAYRNIRERVYQLEHQLRQLTDWFDGLKGTQNELAAKCLEDRGVNARTAQAVADATVELEKISAQVQRMDLRLPSGVGVRR